MKPFLDRLFQHVLVFLLQQQKRYSDSRKKRIMAVDNRENWYAKHGSDMIWMLVFMGIMLGLLSSLWVMSLIGFFREKNRIKSTAILKVLATFAVGLGAIDTWLWFNTLKMNIDGASQRMVDDYVGFGVLCYGIYCLIILIVFGLRIINAFKNTKHAMSKLFHWWLCFLTIIIIICFIVSIIAFFQNNVLMGTISGATATSFTTINGVILLIIFNKKLNKVIGDFLIQFGSVSGETMIKLNIQVSAELQTQTQGNDVGINFDNDTDDKTTGLDKNMVSMNNIIADMIKYTILISVAMGSTSLVPICIGIVRGVDGVPSIYMSFVTIIDIFVNGICLMLQFKMARKYYKILCKVCIKKCQQRQTKQINNSIKGLEKVSSVELKVLPSGGIGIDVNENNNNINEPDEQNNEKAPNINDNTIASQAPAVATMTSVSMQLH